MLFVFMTEKNVFLVCRLILCVKMAEGWKGTPLKTENQERASVWLTAGNNKGEIQRRVEGLGNNRLQE